MWPSFAGLMSARSFPVLPGSGLPGAVSVGPPGLEQLPEGVAGGGQVHLMAGHLAQQGVEGPGGQVGESGGGERELGDLVVVVEVEEGVADELEQVRLVEASPPRRRRVPGPPRGLLL